MTLQMDFLNENVDDVEQTPLLLLQPNKTIDKKLFNRYLNKRFDDIL